MDRPLKGFGHHLWMASNIAKSGLTQRGTCSLQGCQALAIRGLVHAVNFDQKIELFRVFLSKINSTFSNMTKFHPADLILNYPERSKSGPMWANCPSFSGWHTLTVHGVQKCGRMRGSKMWIVSIVGFSKRVPCSTSSSHSCSVLRVSSHEGIDHYDWPNMLRVLIPLCRLCPASCR